MEISREVVEGYLICKYRGHLLLNGSQGTPHDYQRVMAELQELHSAKARERLIHKRLKPPFPSPDDLANLDLHSGSRVILDPVIEDDQVAFRLDAVCRVEGRSALGDFHYIPVLFRQGETMGRLPKILLAVGGLILGKCQGTLPATGLVICGRECVIRTFRLSPLNQRTQKVLDEVEAMIGGKTVPRLILNDHCQQCQFRASCREQAIKADDLSLLGRITEKQLAKYAEKGVTTITQLSYTYRARRSKNVHPKQNPRSLPLHALAIRQKRILVVSKPSLPASDVRIYFDAEGDLERKFTYLLGLLIVQGGKEEMISLWADNPTQQKALFHQFFDVLARFDNYALFHYGQYEAALLRQMRSVVRPKKLADAAIAASVNVLAPLHSGVYFPTYSNGLKEIGRYLGFSWSEENASGLQSLAWRRRWEQTGDDDFKQKLVTYNAEDCRALNRVTEAVNTIGQKQNSRSSGIIWDEVGFEASSRKWGKITFVLPEFDFINKCAYFSYEHDRVYLRSAQLRSRRRKRGQRRHRRWLRPNVRIEVRTSRCPCCSSHALVRVEEDVHQKQVFDLEMRPSGMVRRVIEYWAVPVRCRRCNRCALPTKYGRLDPHRHGLKSWAIYQHVQHHVSLKKLSVLLEDFFRLPVNEAYVHRMKGIMAAYYRPTIKLMKARLLSGPVINIDETQIALRHNKGYVWVLTNHEEVLFIYRPNREAGFLKDLLSGFQGVIVSDYYSGYDGLPNRQQKCLIHLMRDMNGDLRLNPFEDELKALIGEFGTLLRRIVGTIDRHGLTKQWLVKHKREVESFLDRVCGQDYHSLVAQGYRERLTKCREKLFTFLDYDGVPWNNNSAEYAIKQFAEYRALIDGDIEETGLTDFLDLLSICVTCKYKDVGFLRFLLSRENDIDKFAQGQVPKRWNRKLELYPVGFPRGPGRQKPLTRQKSREVADDKGVGRLYNRLMTELKGLRLEVQTGVGDVAFAGVVGKRKSRMRIITLRLNESDPERGLRYVACLDRLSRYFGIRRTAIRRALPAYEKVEQHGARIGECGAGYFKDLAEVAQFLGAIAPEGRRPPCSAVNGVSPDARAVD